MEKGSSSSSVNGLNFGKKIYFENVGSGLQSPSKKGRSGGGVVQGGQQQPPRCQVEGCKIDLSDAKAYYSRHKVCGMHSKSPKVIVAGIEQRFCQQCSRFHQLPEFDQGKRSCRRRLAGHNERRRKPPPVSAISPRYGSLSPTIFDNYSKPGGFVLDFSSSHPNLTGKDSWANTTSERGSGNQLSWQSNSQNPVPDFLQGSSTSSRPSYSGHGVSSVECFGGVSSDSSSALSLLSNQPWGSRTRASTLGLNNFLGTTTNGNEGTLVQPSVNVGAAMGQLGCPSWGFKVNNGNNTLHEMPPDLVLGHISHPANTQYTGELGLAQPIEGQFHELDHSRGYDSTVQHMHWSL